MFKLFRLISNRVDMDTDFNLSDIKGVFKRFHEDEEGQGMTEYIIILVLIAIFVIVVVKVFGQKIKELFSKSKNEMDENIDDDLATN